MLSYVASRSDRPSVAEEPPSIFPPSTSSSFHRRSWWMEESRAGESPPLCPLLIPHPPSLFPSPLAPEIRFSAREWFISVSYGILMWGFHFPQRGHAIYIIFVICLPTSLCVCARTRMRACLPACLCVCVCLCNVCVHACVCRLCQIPFFQA